MVYYNQLDERYADKPYGTDRIGKSGCGPTAMAIVVSSLTDDMVDPAEMAEWAYQHGYWCKGSGYFEGDYIPYSFMQDGKILVADPASYQRSGQSWDLSIILDEASRRAGAGGPFWIIG